MIFSLSSWDNSIQDKLDTFLNSFVFSLLIFNMSTFLSSTEEAEVMATRAFQFHRINFLLHKLVASDTLFLLSRLKHPLEVLYVLTRFSIMVNLFALETIDRITQRT